MGKRILNHEADWMNGPIDPQALLRLGERVASYAPRVREIETFWNDPTLREVQYFFAILEDPQAPCQQRMGWLPRLDPPVTRQAIMEDVDLSLRAQLVLIDRRMEAGLGDMWTPSLWPLCGNSQCTGAFGCQDVFTDAMQYPWVHPVVEKPEDVYSLSPDLRKSAVAQQILRAIDTWRERTHDLIPIRVPDLQGPNTAASQVLGAIQSLEMVMTHPDELHRFLQLYTDVTLEWIRQEVAAAGDNVHWGTFHVRLPYRHVAIAGDSLVLISPDQLREFAVPYYTQLAAESDGFCVHYCGGNTHLLPVLKEIPGFKGVDSQFSLEQYPVARETLGPEPVILTLILDGPPGSTELRPQFLRRYLEMIKGDRTIIWLRARTVDEARRLEEIVHTYGR